MNKSLSLFVLSLLIAVAFGQDKLFGGLGSGNRFVSVVHTFSEALVIPSNLDDNGRLEVTVTADTTVTVCINERVQVTAGINSCSIGGLFNFTWNTTMSRSSFGVQSAAVPITKTAYLRFGKAKDAASPRTYYVSYQFVWDNPAVNDTGVTIVINGKRCAAGDNGVGPSCGKYVPAITELVPGTAVPLTLNSKTPRYFLFTAADQYNFTQVEITGFDRSKDLIFLYGKRGGYPQYNSDLGAVVGQSLDWIGVESGGNRSTIFLNFGRPDDYWFTVAGNDTNNIAFSILLTTGAAANKDAMKAQMPPFGITKDNNTVEYDADTSNGGITYLRFDRNELKIGIAPKDDSDGSPDVFADIDLVPSAQSNLISNTNSTEEAHLISATSVPKANGFFWYTFTADSQKAVDTIWYVAVNSTNAFVVWDASVGACANNCTGRGVCDESRGLCICDDGYERYDCSDKVFPLVWIILIAIGGAILLAIAIGVPVSCYVNNKKKSGYERV
jgi:hypothetical protein